MILQLSDAGQYTMFKGNKNAPIWLSGHLISDCFPLIFFVYIQLCA